MKEEKRVVEKIGPEVSAETIDKTIDDGFNELKEIQPDAFMVFGVNEKTHCNFCSGIYNLITLTKMFVSAIREAEEIGLAMRLALRMHRIEKEVLEDDR